MEKQDLLNKVQTLKKGAFYKALVVKGMTESKHDFVGGKKGWANLLQTLNITEIKKVSTLTIRFGIRYDKVSTFVANQTPTLEKQIELQERQVRPYYVNNISYTNQYGNTLLQCYMGGLGNKTWYLDQNGNDITALVKAFKKSSTALSKERYLTMGLDNIVDIDKASVINNQLKNLI